MEKPTAGRASGLDPAEGRRESDFVWPPPEEDLDDWQVVSLFAPPPSPLPEPVLVPTDVPAEAPLVKASEKIDVDTVVLARSAVDLHNADTITIERPIVRTVQRAADESDEHIASQPTISAPAATIAPLVRAAGSTFARSLPATPLPSAAPTVAPASPLASPATPEKTREENVALADTLTFTPAPSIAPTPIRPIARADDAPAPQPKIAPAEATSTPSLEDTAVDVATTKLETMAVGDGLAERRQAGAAIDDVATETGAVMVLDVAGAQARVGTLLDDVLASVEPADVLRVQGVDLPRTLGGSEDTARTRVALQAAGVAPGAMRRGGGGGRLTVAAIVILAAGASAYVATRWFMPQPLDGAARIVAAGAATRTPGGARGRTTTGANAVTTGSARAADASSSGANKPDAQDGAGAAASSASPASSATRGTTDAGGATFGSGADGRASAAQDVGGGTNAASTAIGGSASSAGVGTGSGLASAAAAAVAVAPAAGVPPVPGETSLEVRSLPSGATVIFGGRERGITPLVLTGLVPGRHDVMIEGPFPRVLRHVDVAAGSRALLIVSSGDRSGNAPPPAQKTPFEEPPAAPAPAAPAPPMAPGMGRLVVQSPLALDIIANGRRIGNSGDGSLPLAPGSHELELINESVDYREVTTVHVSAGQRLVLPVEVPQSTLTVEATPGTRVWVDGREVGEVSRTQLALPIGPHEVLFRHPDFGERRVTALVKVGLSARAAVDFKAVQP